MIYANRIAEVNPVVFPDVQKELEFQPTGTLLDRYSTAHGDFSIYLSTLTSPASVSFFKNVQSLGYWFIEGASEIVVTADSPHRWLMLTLYSHVTSQWVLVGYSLLYVFSNPFQRPSQSLRLCQILLLPPFQRQSHSSHLLDAVYRRLMHTPVSALLPQSYAPADPADLPHQCAFAMLTVEDPCPQCTFVRDVFDCRLLRRMHVMQPYLAQPEVRPLSEDTVQEVRRTTGIIAAQLQKCYNILLHHLHPERPRAYRVYVGG